MNRKFVRVIGMARSGIHAVAEWSRMSLAQHGYSVLYENAVPMERPNDIARWLPPKGDLNEPFLWMIEHEDINFLDMPVLSPKIYTNFEYADVLVIRDVINTMASRRKLNPALFSRRSLQLWKQYALEALGQTDFLGPNKIVVNFNQWYQQPHEGGVRANVAAQFGIEGVGVSSSERLAVASAWDSPATPVEELKLFERWKNYADDTAFWALFDKQALDLNAKLFGRNPEAEAHIK